MKTYFLNIPNELKKLSLKLDVKALLCSKTWEVFNLEGNKEIFIFQYDGSLFISTNGNVIISKWQFIPTNAAIIITAEKNTTMLRPAFIDEIVLAMQKDGTKEYLFLIDEHKQAICPHRTLDELSLYFINKTKESPEYLEAERKAKRQAKQQERQRKELEKQKELHEKLQMEELRKTKQLQMEQLRKTQQSRLANIAYLHQDEIDSLFKQRPKEIKKGIIFTSVALVISFILSCLFKELEAVHSLLAFTAFAAFFFDVVLVLCLINKKKETKREIISKHWQL